MLQLVIEGLYQYNEGCRLSLKVYVLGNGVVNGVRRNEFNSCLKKCDARFRLFIGATNKWKHISSRLYRMMYLM